MSSRRFASRIARPTFGWLVLPATVFLAVFFAYPAIRLLLLSVTSPALTGANYHRLVTTPVYMAVLVNTIKVSAGVAAICVLLAYPLAFYLAMARERVRNLLLVAIVLPFFTSILVRSYAWMVLLGREGVVNKLLQRLGITDAPLHLIYNTTGLLISLTHILLPTATFLLLSAMRGIDPQLLRVSSSLGANRLQTFLRVYLPLSLPGVGAAAVLVFIFTIGNYVTPALVGGPRNMMLAMVVAQQVNEVLNWPFAGALATLLTGVTVVLFFLFNRALNLDRLWGGQALRDTASRPRSASVIRSRINWYVLGAIDKALYVLSDGFAASRAGLLRAGRARLDVPRTVLLCFVVLVLIFLLVPILLIIPISFTASLYLAFPPEGLSLRWYRTLIDQSYWVTSSLLSLRVGGFAMLFSLLLGIPAALVLVRRRFAARNAAYAFLIMPLIVPSITIAVALYYFFAPLHLVGTATGLVIAHTIGGTALVTVIMAAALQGFDNRVELASSSLGAGPLRTFAKVTLPLLRPAILTAAFFAFMHSFDEVVIATFVGGVSAETLPKKMWEGVELEIRPTLAALSTLLIGVTVVMLLGIELTQLRRRRA